MASPLALLFGVHAHQPAGNFPEVLESAHARCYRPFLETLHDYPRFRFAAHFSGPLLDFLFERHPEDMKLLEEMVARGQVEMFGAGDTEPVLAVISSRDRVGQVNKLSRKLQVRFGTAPRGAWLTERVWEATVVPALADCGIEYVTVDDYHFLCTGKTAAELDGYFTTEEDGRRLDLFPISEALRYLIPFAPAEETLAHLEKLAGDGHAASIYFDDIEKFGIWPETHEWVYGRGWLRRFIEAVLASERVAPRTFVEFHAGHRTRGIVYLPTTAYVEMNEWTLPQRAGDAFAGLVKHEKERGTYQDHKAFLRGGIWKNFLSRYPEANWMHKRVSALSRRLEGLGPSARTTQPTEALETLLFAAQANDAYWHGLFGGLYLPHLRRGVYRSLVTLEALLDQASPRAACAIEDADSDGCDELFLRGGEVQAVVKLDGRASLCELDAYALGQNFGDTLRRHAEHYHLKAVSGEADAKPASGIASAHERFGRKHEIAESDLVPDARARTLLVDAWLPEAGDSVAIDSYALESSPHAPAAAQALWRAHAGRAWVQKRITVADARVVADYRIETAQSGRFQVELDVAMPSCDGFAGRYIHRGEILGGFGQPLALEASEGITLDDRFLDGRFSVACSRPMRLEACPYFTVSQSEEGLEKIMQSVTITLSWAVEPGTCDASLTLEMRGGPAEEPGASA